VTRIRLRPSRPTASAEASFYAERYPGGYRHNVWADHVERIAASAEMIGGYAGRFRTAADLSCGDGALLTLVGRHLETAYLGDLNGAPTMALVSGLAGSTVGVPPGLLPDTLEHLPEPVDLFVLSETIEHVDDPEALLRAVRDHARHLFLSTPVEERADSGNTEHYWSWGVDDVHDLLTDSGWSPLEYRVFVPESTLHSPDAYRFQLWMAEAQ
jgi:hypothetical protein